MEETYRSVFKRRLSELKKNDDIIVSFEDSIGIWKPYTRPNRSSRRFGNQPDFIGS